MADANDEDFGKELAAAFAADMDAHADAADPTTPPAKANEDPKPDEATPPAPKVEEPKKDEPANPEDPNKKNEEPETPPADPAKPKEENPANPENPETPPAEEPPAAAQPLTRDDLTQILRDMRNQDRISSTAVEDETNAVMDAYYPDGLSNTLVDQRTGKELKTPQDVVDASGGEMSAEEAAQWLLNEQYKLDKNIEKIRGDARNIAETTVTFRTNSMAALEKYEPLFKAFPKLQSRVFDKMMKFVKADEKKNVILSAPDPMEFYDDYLEPYMQAYEYQTKQSATNPVTPPTNPPAPATPSVDDRLDETGDGGASEVDNPNDFAQQVKKELAKGF